MTQLVDTVMTMSGPKTSERYPEAGGKGGPQSANRLFVADYSREMEYKHFMARAMAVYRGPSPFEDPSPGILERADGGFLGPRARVRYKIDREFGGIECVENVAEVRVDIDPGGFGRFRLGMQVYGCTLVALSVTPVNDFVSGFGKPGCWVRIVRSVAPSPAAYSGYPPTLCQSANGGQDVYGGAVGDDAFFITGSPGASVQLAVSWLALKPNAAAAYAASFSDVFECMYGDASLYHVQATASDAASHIANKYVRDPILDATRGGREPAWFHRAYVLYTAARAFTSVAETLGEFDRSTSFDAALVVDTATVLARRADRLLRGVLATNGHWRRPSQCLDALPPACGCVMAATTMRDCGCFSHGG